MKASTVLSWARHRLRYLMEIAVAVAAAYGIDRWFLAGVFAGKLIGLPQKASVMKELEDQSRNWGIVAAILESAALALVWPRWPKDELALPKGSPLTLTTERNVWAEYIGRCLLYTGACLPEQLCWRFLSH